ncbi:peptidase domain-containing ABC transporter [Methylovorus glucosotrophus]|uniref:peptidase domain-containing ABC transporter n=1 Tax=Methylovorus glucosotrophus TaxID=266009 RepID=UPI0013311D48|nr:ATP-binding cassette domain-containing protein [Methylovorus glucosotrophus]
MAPYGLEIGLSSFIINACGLLMPLFSMLIYDKVVGNGNVETLWTLVAGMLLVLVLEFTLRTIRAYVTQRLGAIAELHMEGRFIDRLLTTNAQQVASPGVLMSRYRDLASARDALLAQYAVVAADMPFMLLFLLAQGLIGGWLVMIPILFALPILLGQWLSNKPERDYSSRTLGVAARKASLLSELAGNLAFLQISPLRHLLADRWESEMYQGAILRGRQRFWQTAGQAWVGMCIGLASVTLLAVGVYRIEAGAISVGALIACSLIQLRAMLQLSSAASLLLGWKDLNRTQAELDAAAQPEANASYVQMPIASGKGDISVTQLTCHNQDGDVTLDHVNLAFGPGERIAVIGRPGSGKSTLLRCMAGVQTPSEGQVLLNAMRVEAYSPDQRALAITYKPQEPYLLGPCLQDNLARMDSLRAEQAMLLTGLAAALKSGELRRDQVVSAGMGPRLSAGQCQIVVLARSLSEDPRVFLLDEPTAGVDGETEAKLVDAVDQLTRGKTVILATHSLALLKKMDRIVVLERGKVVASGTPERLLQPATGQA